eukprot:COSAG05_NODE_145_length_16478_cov_15.287197_12_plen_95_part_00
MYAFVTSCSPWAVFIFYFFDDQVAPHGYFLFSHRVTHSTQSAMSLIALVTQILNVIFPLLGGCEWQILVGLCDHNAVDPTDKHNMKTGAHCMNL